MGALTSNRKRVEDYLKLQSSNSPSTPTDHSYGHMSKKSKLSISSNQNMQETSRHVSSYHIVSSYPVSKPAFNREPHAPEKKRSWFSKRHQERSHYIASSSYTDSSAEQKEKIELPYNEAREPMESVINRKENSFFVEKERENKAVIEVDDNDDSGVEEIEIVEISDSELKEENRDVGTSYELKNQMVENKMRSLDYSVVTDVNILGSKVDDGEKMMDSMVVVNEPGPVQLALYKMLLDSANKNNGKLDRLRFDIGLTEKRMQRHQSLRSWKKAAQQIEKDVSEECFTPLTEDEVNGISRALSNSNRRSLLASHKNSNIDISVEKLQCLRPGGWLNDEVINVYLELLKEREKREPQKFLKCHFFSSFFYKKLISGRGGYNFQSVRRWTTQKKLGYSLLECDKIFVPIHQQIHWCLAIINKKEQKFQYLDSLGGIDSRVLDVLVRYYVDEVKDKNGKDINVSSWDIEYVKDLPDQQNGFDCGMFMIKYADFYSRDIGLCFSQKDMPYFRLRTAKEIMKLRAE